MKIICHITTHAEWENSRPLGIYKSSTLETEGYTHCSHPDQVIDVANALFQGRSGLVLLCIDSDLVCAEIRYEAPSGSHQMYPHIYGPLNLEAVVKVISFEPEHNGKFTCPRDLGTLSRE